LKEEQAGKSPETRVTPSKRQAMSRRTLAIISGVVAVLVLAITLAWRGGLLGEQIPSRMIPYSEFKMLVRSGAVDHVVIDEQLIAGVATTDHQPWSFSTRILPTGDPRLAEEMQQAGIQYGVGQIPLTLSEILLTRVLPLLGLAGAGFFAYRYMSGKPGSLPGGARMTRSRATEVKSEMVTVTFDDVGGADEAVEELQEVIQFLTAPERFARLGGRVPKGVLLVGPPGTGKTLLAKATAGQAGVRFFQTSGSEFMEMYVGVGAARVRSLFEQARKAAPAVVFIDEIDSIGQSRSGPSSARSGANDERDQTLNQLLAEIDGFKPGCDAPVIIMAASNRPEVLDAALLRAGRFDRQITVGQPDLKGRLQVLRIHCKKLHLDEDFEIERAARITPGFSGADLANVMNEAALLAARRNCAAIGMAEFEAAMERVVAGLERKGQVMNPAERRAIAYHEAGHAVVAELLPTADPVAKVSIIPRGRGALGYTMQMPTEDRYLLTDAELADRITVLMAGRAAEKLILGAISTGASDDIAKATELARRMVSEFGMSESLGSVRYAGPAMQFAGGAAESSQDLSMRTREMIDLEIQGYVTRQYERAQQLLKQHRAAVQELAERLLSLESLDGSVVREVLACEAMAHGLTPVQPYSIPLA
jgi:cell division protease FtsH